MNGGINMKEYYYFFNSVTTAMRGETLLRNKGIRASVFRDGTLNPHGCGYIIKVRGNKEEISALLQKAGIRFNEVREV